MTPVDDLHVHQWIAVVGATQPEPISSPFGLVMGPPPHRFSGEPLRIVAKSLPFLAVWNLLQNRMETLDVRHTEVQLLHRTYVKVAKQCVDGTVVKLKATEDVKAKLLEMVTGIKQTPAEDAPAVDIGRQREHQEILKQLRQDWTCPNCMAPLIETRVDNGVWQKVCRDCGFGGVEAKS